MWVKAWADSDTHVSSMGSRRRGALASGRVRGAARRVRGVTRLALRRARRRRRGGRCPRSRGRDEPAGADRRHVRAPDAGPASLFVKLAPLDPVHREMIGATGMGEREVRFYADVAPSLELRVPRAHHVRDLRGRRLRPAARGPRRVRLRVLRRRVGRHGRCRRRRGRGSRPLPRALRGPPRPSATSHHGWAFAVARRTELTAQRLRTVLDEHGDRLTATYVAVGRALRRASRPSRRAVERRAADVHPRRPAHRQRLPRRRAGRLPRLGPVTGQHAPARRELLPHDDGRSRRAPADRTRPAAPLPRRRSAPPAAPTSPSTTRGPRIDSRPATPWSPRSSPSPPRTRAATARVSDDALRRRSELALDDLEAVDAIRVALD